MARTFDHLIILGRPAAGKSELIDFMKKTADSERANIFHIGHFEEVDDFPWLWEKFTEDDLWEEAGYERLFSICRDGNYSVAPDKGLLYKFMMAKFNREMQKKYLSRPDFYKDGTVFIEFSRGCENTYKDALSRLSKKVLEKAAIFYLKVSFEESWRRNVARYEEKLKHSSLAHMAPRDVMERFYKVDDWDELTSGKDFGTLNFHGIEVPFVTLNNEPELKEYDALAKRYKPALDRLIEMHNRKNV